MDILEIANACPNILPGYQRARPLKAVLSELAETLDYSKVTEF